MSAIFLFHNEPSIKGNCVSKKLIVCSAHTKSLPQQKNNAPLYRHETKPPFYSQPPFITGLAGSQGPITTFLYFCNPINHQLHPPIPTPLPSPQAITPHTILFHLSPLPERTIPMPAPAPTTKARVRSKWPRQEMWRR